MARRGWMVAALMASLVSASCTDGGGDAGSSTTTATGQASEPPGPSPVSVRDFGAAGTGQGDDTLAFERAIAAAQEAEGNGIVDVPVGDYRLRSVHLESGTTVRIAAGTRLEMAASARGNDSIFELETDDDASFLEDVAVVGVGGRFVVDLRTTPTPRNHAFIVRNVRHFRIANLEVRQNDTNPAGGPPSSFAAAITFRATPASTPTRLVHPIDGVVSNVLVTGAPYGFGATQVTSGARLRFRGITSHGGVALRLEPDGVHPGRIQTVRASGIHCRRGHAAVTFSPHGQHNADVQVRRVTAVGCESGIDIGGATGTGSGGTFTRSSVHDVEVVAARGAQLGVGGGAWRTGISPECVQRSPTAAFAVTIVGLRCDALQRR